MREFSGRRAGRTGCLAILALTLASCASIPPRPLVADSNAASLEARELDDPRLLAFLAAADASAPAGGRWDLHQLTLAAVYFHPDLDVADAQLAVAQAAIRTAAQRPNPSFNLTPQFNATNANPTAWTIGTAINLLLELFGKREARTDEAKALTEAARFDVANVSWQVRGRVRAAMLALWGAEQRAGLIARRRDLQTELAALVERRLAAGDVSALDAGRERANRDILVLAVSDAARDIADARVSLASAIGVPVHALTGLVLDYAALADAKQPSDVATLRKTALTARSDVRASLARYAASEAALKLQLANRLPNLSIGPGYQYDQGDNKFSLSLQTDLPVFNANGGPVAEAMAHRREAAANFTALQAGIITEIDRAEAARKSTGASLVAADTLAAQQADRARRNMRVFNAGAIDRVTLLTGEIDYAAGQESRLQALIAERTALGQLEDALRVPIFTKALPAASTNRTMP